MDHSNHTPLSAAELTESNLVGAPIYGLDDRKVGSVSHLHDSGSTGAAVVGVVVVPLTASSPALVRVSGLHMVRAQAAPVLGMRAWTKAQLQAVPEHKHEAAHAGR